MHLFCETCALALPANCVLLWWLKFDILFLSETRNRALQTIELFCRRHSRVIGCPRKFDFHNKY